MTDYDAIVIGAGHNGLAAAVLLQKAGLRTLCLESKLYAGGMASTVELFDGYHFEIAGSVQFPTAPVVREALGLDTISTIDLDVMSVALRGVGDDPVVQYSDPIKLFTHLNEVHGADAVNGMVGLMAWAQAPTRAPAKTLDAMYACATNEFERSAIDDMLFGSDRRARPVSSRPREAWRAARLDDRAGGEHSLPRAGHTGQCGRLGLRTRCSRRRHHADEKAARRHRRAHRASGRFLGHRWRRGQAAHEGDRNSGQRRPCERGKHRGGGDPHRPARRLRDRARPADLRTDRPR